MRSFHEPTLKNLLRRPTVLGVPFEGLLALSFMVLTTMISFGNSKFANALTSILAVGGYIALRLCTRFMVDGWILELIYPLEKKLKKSGEFAESEYQKSDIEILSPDTLEKESLIYEKEIISTKLLKLKSGEDLILEFQSSENGVLVKAGYSLVTSSYCYSLKSLPVRTNPLFMFDILSRIQSPFKVLVRVTGISHLEAKRKVEGSRRRNARDLSTLTNIDSEVTFEESSNVLEGMSRGDERIAEFSMVIVSDSEIELDSELFHLEKSHELTLFSVMGIRKRHFRSFFLRLTTISDLIPNFSDPIDGAASVLTSIRNKPMYFSPQDSRLESLHWLVVGATGTGKSFFTGVILKRLIDQKVQMSVLFVDHNRSFRRLVRHQNGLYQEPQSIEDVHRQIDCLEESLGTVGSFSGIELSDLCFEEKKVASKILLEKIESFLRNRNSAHPVYVVLDECWNFLRDEPVLVQRAFREFRKLNGAVIAITQSLSDFMSDQSGRSIVQNAPIRILLRQGEDPENYKGVLGLNSVEIQRLRMLRQEKGSFSECIIKTSFLSRLARLYPSKSEFELLRTDNLREELIRESKERLMEVGHV